MSDTVAKNVKHVLLARKRETDDFQERARRAEKAEGELPGLREQLARYVDRQEHFKCVGKNRIEFPQAVPYKNYGTIELEPVRSKLTGDELAATVQPRIEEIQGEIEGREKAIRDFLAH